VSLQSFSQYGKNGVFREPRDSAWYNLLDFLVNNVKERKQ